MKNVEESLTSDSRKSFQQIVFTRALEDPFIALQNTGIRGTILTCGPQFPKQSLR